MEKVIAVFDVGKTNKKLLLFNPKLELVYQDEQKIPPVLDDDGFECDDIDFIEEWVKTSLDRLLRGGKFNVLGVNFSTYGASLLFLDNKGQRITPLYNYLKPIPEIVQNQWYQDNGGKDEFCRKTASPPLEAMLNSGVQILWLKRFKDHLFKKVNHILHFPQYLSFILTQKVVADYTSIGCHTGLWDFDTMTYHPWLLKEGIFLPQPINNSEKFQIDFGGNKLWVGIGIHDSSASLAPYLLAKVEPFILLSTGTWCINMNPFNHHPLTLEQLKNDCLSYLSIDKKPVKSSRFFLGHIHDLNVNRLCEHFNVGNDYFKRVVANDQLIKSFMKDGKNSSSAFFRFGVPDNFVDDQIDLNAFNSFEEAYHRLMFDLTRMNVRSINLILDKTNGIKNIFISGGFAKNEIFVKLIAAFFPEMNVYTSNIDNASALGAAMVIADIFGEQPIPEINLNLKQVTF
ncbi:FGGY-family carbohydrate kinase [Thermophagus xiamenensis]|uniref:Sugar (Pentulose or hexulose) kinase n=1 Tax=Thermophagus xiamenensis TaxID=385682 RepID=A0A1I2BEQ3_9BACT|nr:FGGY family carbohydrate kinase [Thermophagus xiamenensis]SFE53630.1 Sugar (pentulose or hexulose) kinase [Thermophagus xiamenensis]